MLVGRGGGPDDPPPLECTESAPLICIFFTDLVGKHVGGDLLVNGGNQFPFAQPREATIRN